MRLATGTYEGDRHCLAVQAKAVRRNTVLGNPAMGTPGREPREATFHDVLSHADEPALPVGLPDGDMARDVADLVATTAA